MQSHESNKSVFFNMSKKTKSYFRTRALDTKRNVMGSRIRFLHFQASVSILKKTGEGFKQINQDLAKTNCIKKNSFPGL